MGRVAGLTAEQARERLLAAAAEVFVESGYEGARTSEIARRAGLSTGAIYSRYKTKAELLNEAIRAHVPARLDELFKVDSGASVAEAIRELGVQLPERPPETGLLLAEALVAGRRDAEVGETFTAGVGRHLAALEAIIALAQRDGGVEGGLSAAALARLCMAIVFGSHFINAIGGPPVDRGEWAAVIDRVVEAMRSE